MLAHGDERAGYRASCAVSFNSGLQPTRRAVQLGCVGGTLYCLGISETSLATEPRFVGRT